MQLIRKFVFETFEFVHGVDYNAGVDDLHDVHHQKQRRNH